MSALRRNTVTGKGITRRKGVNSGFTLVELLVVIAIIALLMSILMPALSAVREQARSIACRSNVRQLLYAWMMYRDENDDKLVNGHTANNCWVAAGNGQPGGDEQACKNGLLWPYIKNVDTYHCPSDKRKKIPAHKYGWRTYSITGGMNGVNPAGAWEIIPYTRYSEIKRPGDKYVFLAESDKRGYNNGSWVLYPRSRQWVDPLGVWHRDNGNTLGFADGHTEMRNFRGRGFIDWNLLALYEPAKFNFFRTPNKNDPEEMADFEYMLDHYGYKSLQ